jgi:hypothetical protein
MRTPDPTQVIERQAGACGFGVDEGYHEVVLDFGSGPKDVMDRV